MTQRDMNSYLGRIRRMNTVFKLPCNDVVTDQGADRVRAFYKVILDEIREIPDCVNPDGSVDLVKLADVLADIQVYCNSENVRWGIPTAEVLHAVMDSQDSKLDENGNPLMAPDGSKFIKGPNYQPPEKMIEAILKGFE